MKRYEYNGQSITIPLNKDKYYITAYIKLLHKEPLKYSTTLKLTDKDALFDWVIEEDIITKDIGDKKNIFLYITEIIEKLNKNGYFDSYISKYEENIKLFCVGAELEEQKRKVRNENA